MSVRGGLQGPAGPRRRHPPPLAAPHLARPLCPVRCSADDEDFNVEEEDDEDGECWVLMCSGIASSSVQAAAACATQRRHLGLAAPLGRRGGGGGGAGVPGRLG